jgi:hypothetical protein
MTSPIKPLRENRPCRKCTKTYKKYGSFKRFLQEDFNARCGYCNDPDSYDGGYKHYHIDHFIPKVHLKAIKENEYKNLVYACFSCNNSKGDDWPSRDESITTVGSRGYIDPCESRYDRQFYRGELGDIIARTKLGQYMYEQMKLDLRRHAIIWILDKLDTQIKSLSVEKNKSGLDVKTKRKIDSLIKKLEAYYYEYTGILKDENNK